jgi:hypothetical protein
VSVTAIFNRVEGESLRTENMIGMRAKLFLRGQELVDEHGLVLAELIKGDDGRWYWRPIGRDNEPGWKPDAQWLCQEIAIVGQGRLNL